MISKTVAEDEGCVACRFWDGGDSYAGRCRRGPPQASVREDENSWWVETFWPVTSPKDWCGEWRTRRVPGDSE